MDDHCYKGTPTSKMPLHKIYEILADGGVSIDGVDHTDGSEQWYWIKMRLEIELVRRAHGWPIIEKN